MIAGLEIGEMSAMGPRIGLTTAMLAGMVAGACVVQVLHAETSPPVYFVGEIDVTNPEGYATEYLPKARAIIKAHGGQLIAAGGASGAGNQVMPVDGEPPKRVVIYRYPSVAAVYAWRHDSAYEAVRKIGEKYAKYRTFAVAGISK